MRVTFNGRISTTRMAMLGMPRLLAACALFSLMLWGAEVHATVHKKPPPPPAVLWYAPFLSGGGYCSEAHSCVEAIDWAIQARRDSDARALLQQQEQTASDPQLHTAADGSRDVETSGTQRKRLQGERPFGLYITQHGDSYGAAFIRDMPDDMRQLLEEHWIEERDFRWRLKNTKVALAICHSEPGAWEPAHYKTSRCPPEQALYTVGRTMFETDRVPSGWTDRMNKMDEIWVPTKFQQQIFIDNGVRPESVYVISEAVDVHFFDPATVDEPYDLVSDMAGAKTITPQTTVFLSVFKWEERKGWKILLRAYFAAFSASKEDVALVILTSGYHAASDSASDFLAIIRDFARTELDKELSELPLVHVLPPRIPQQQLPSLYKAATAFVLPSRGEGWGRPHVEAMAMGLPIISTFWSGTTEYMTEDNSYPLRIDGLVEIQDGAFRGHKWAEPSVTHLVELLLHVYQHPDEAREKGRRARDDMVIKYAPIVIGKVLLAHIERVLAIVATREQENTTSHAMQAEDEETHDEL